MQLLRRRVQSGISYALRLKEFLDSDADIYLQHYRIFDNPYLDPEFVDNLCREYKGTIYYDRYIEGLWKRAEGAIYRKFADAPESFMCSPGKDEISKIVVGCRLWWEQIRARVRSNRLYRVREK